ncbi:hypothetical protein HY792_01360 [Candidatus Desantisbacteria bacterium]|nr:hypothetical protein [Candidatus Desantisbacteria bacterium]
MSYKIIPTEHFKQQVRTLQKSYSHIRNDLEELSNILKQNPKEGTALGKGIYKIRLASSDVHKGKKGGYRIITYVVDEEQKIRLLTIYIKPKKATITDGEIMWILKKEGLV